MDRLSANRLRVLVGLVCGLWAVSAVSADTDTTAGTAISRATGARATGTRVAGTLDHRVSVLAKALDLDARQQGELSRILAGQRAAVRKIWSDPALLAAERVPATRALEDRTADQIRAILNDEQKKKYNPPKPPPAPAPASGPPNVGAWMEATRAH